MGSSEDQLERSIDQVVSLLEAEIERLKESLETFRLSNNPNRGDLIHWHVRTLDERQDALEELQKLILSRQKSDKTD